MRRLGLFLAVCVIAWVSYWKGYQDAWHAATNLYVRALGYRLAASRSAQNQN